jgi:hypothetical protein
MTETNQFARAPRRADPEEDLSDEISHSVDKQPGDDVRCTLVGNGNYRCNWWAARPTGAFDNPGMGGLLVTTHRVRQSRMLHAARDGQRLVIHEVARR